MSKLTLARGICILIMLIGFVWLTIDVFDNVESDSLQAAAIVTWAGLIGNAVCALIRLKKENKK